MKLSFAKLISTSTTKLVKHDRLRVNNMKAGKARGLKNRAGIISSPATNDYVVSYVASVGVGDPPTNCKWLQRLVADFTFLTGSSFHRQTYRWHGKVSGSYAAPPISTAQIIFHSSNTWVGANTPYVKTTWSTSSQTSDSVVSGLEFVFMRYCLLSRIFYNLKDLFALIMGQAASAASFRWALQSDLNKSTIETQAPSTPIKSPSL